MCNHVPLHHYFSTLGALSTECFDRPELILVDDNARVSAPLRISTSKLSLRKISRWDSSGCLPRLDYEEPSTVSPISSFCDCSPSLLMNNNRKTIQVRDSLSLALAAPILRRCQSEQVFHSAWDDSGNSGPLNPDQPLRRPMRYNLVELSNQVPDDDCSPSADDHDDHDDPQQHYNPISNLNANIIVITPHVPSRLCQLPYPIPQEDSTTDLDFDDMVGLDWD